jgi:hypothetical protein
MARKLEFQGGEIRQKLSPHKESVQKMARKLSVLLSQVLERL